MAFDVEKKKSDKELHNNLTEKDNRILRYLSEKTNSFIDTIEQVELLYSVLKIEVMILYIISLLINFFD